MQALLFDILTTPYRQVAEHVSLETAWTALVVFFWVAVSLLGVNLVFWALVSALRGIHEKTAAFCKRLMGTTRTGNGAGAPMNTPDITEVAVLIPAHNEEAALPRCLEALLKVFEPSQIYVANDSSRDATSAIARAAGCNVCDIEPNGGKAHALQYAINTFQLCDRYTAVLIQDADSELDPLYPVHALPLLAEPDVAVVAGHVVSRWPSMPWPRPHMIYAAYRTRLYRMMQSTFQYGQSWKCINVSYIAPGFASMYRSSVLRELEITAPGLAIEDFNMTFEVQHRRLGRIAYTPGARCSSEDPSRLIDYRKQVYRWYLGFWQTVWRHGVWPSGFCLSLGFMLAELIFINLFILALPIVAIAYEIAELAGYSAALSAWPVHVVSPLGLLMFFIAVDYVLTIAVTILEDRPSLLFYGLGFGPVRVLDAALFLCALFSSFSAKSDGRWTSPQRLSASPDAVSITHELKV